MKYCPFASLVLCNSKHLPPGFIAQFHVIGLRKKEGKKAKKYSPFEFPARTYSLGLIFTISSITAGCEFGQCFHTNSANFPAIKEWSLPPTRDDIPEGHWADHRMVECENHPVNSRKLRRTISERMVTFKFWHFFSAFWHHLTLFWRY